MSVKNLTIFSILLFVAACGRQPRVRVYLEEIQVPAQTPQQVAGGPSRQALPAELPPDHPLRTRENVTADLPPDHPLRTMTAPPLTVDPVPENLPPGHPTFDMAGAPALTDPNPPRRPVPAPSSAAPSSAAPMMGRESEVPPPPSASDLAWEVPDGWRQQAGAGMRLASFSIEGDTSGALTTLIVLGAGAGGVDANITRWRGERGLPPDAPNEPMRVGGQIEFVFVDMVNESIEAGHDLTTVGAIFDLGNRTAFLKFVGPPDVVARQRIPFLQLAGSLRRVEETP
ncbi:MAG: hypothetical protein JJU05_18910 [Verrucomicrobia bacterium]|nr:hypothetical protein [Verrucomicrobiota bacterium]MCH8528334.1 hypothetical protein [Kiritimatiellia bacterium]